MGKTTFKDLTAQTFNHWTVLERAPSKTGHSYWKCVCDVCGTEKIVRSERLLSGCVECNVCLTNARDLTGKKIERLTVLGRASPKRNRPRWRCVCECGVVLEVYEYSLLSGNTKSCGCLQRERTSKAKTIHGHNRKHHTTCEYKSRSGMIQRCCNPHYTHYEDYGGQGITVSPLWENNFVKFLADVGRAPLGFSIDRIDNNGNYEPGNVRWSPPPIQAQGRRGNKHTKIGIKGTTIQRNSSRFEARIGHSGLNPRLGSYDTAEEAGLAWMMAAHEIHERPTDIEGRYITPAGMLAYAQTHHLEHMLDNPPQKVLDAIARAKTLNTQQLRMAA